MHKVQPEVNRDQAETSNVETHPPALPSNEEVHAATVRVGVTIAEMGYVNYDLGKHYQRFTS